MFVISGWPGPDKRIVQGRCPNEGHACNCIGKCQMVVVDKDDPRTDEEVLRDRDASTLGWNARVHVGEDSAQGPRSQGSREER